MTEQEFCQVVAQVLKGDHNDLRKEAIILRAHRQALATPSQPDPQSRVAAEPVGLREAKASFKTALADLGKRDAVHWWGTDDSQHAERMKACKARCKRWGDCDEEDGSCAECDSDMAEALETRGSMKRRLRNYEARVDRFFQSDGLRAAQAALATPSQRDPQSRGQAFDGEGEALSIAGNPNQRISRQELRR